MGNSWEEEGMGNGGRGQDSNMIKNGTPVQTWLHKTFYMKHIEGNTDTERKPTFLLIWYSLLQIPEERVSVDSAFCPLVMHAKMNGQGEVGASLSESGKQ